MTTPAEKRKLRIATVADVQIMRTLYGGPFESGSSRACPYCGERTPRDPCVHCGWPISENYYVKPDKP